MSSFLIIGAGSRGTAYARAVAITSTTADSAPSARIAAIAEPDRFKRAEFGRKFIWGTRDNDHGQPRRGEEFTDWRKWIAWEDARRANADSSSSLTHPNGVSDDADAEVVITGVFVCTLDESHAEILRALAHLNLHVLCEKPLALSLEDCLSIQAAYGSNDTINNVVTASRKGDPGEHRQRRIFSIGHVLRYSPHNTLLRRLLLHDRAIGNVISLEHTEPVGWWHFAHSYVRGNWRRETPEGVGTLLTKSCHDIDFIMWLLCSPADAADRNATAHLPSTITSTGSLSHFRRARKPRAAGNTTNCLTCPLSDSGCAFSAKQIYRDRWLRGERDTGWPLKIVVPEIENLVSTSGWEAAEDALMRKLGEDYEGTDATGKAVKRVQERSWYGRCVYDSDNNVVDDQTVTITWDEEAEDSHLPSSSSSSSSSLEEHTTHGPKTAVFHLSFATSAQCDRRGRIYGSAGEIAYDSKRISVYTFADDKTIEHVLPPPSFEAEKNHGGGDLGLARSFVQAVQVVEAGTMGVQEAQARFVGGDLEEIVRSHAVVFAAEEARRGRGVVRFREWLEGKERQVLRRMGTEQKQQERWVVGGGC
jgi:predicted dehydrogenase